MPKSDTGKLNPKDRDTYIIPALSRYGASRPSDNIEFEPVPKNYRSLENDDPWRILMKFADPAPRVVIGLDIYGDVTIGRGPGSKKRALDIDVSRLNAKDLGVSRLHAFFRPTKRNLFLIDLGSTNGTYVNAIPVNRGMAQTLKTGDTVTLAGLSFEIQVISQPGEEKSDEVPAAAIDSSLDPLPSVLAGFSAMDGESTLMMKAVDPEEAKKDRDKQGRLSRLRSSFTDDSTEDDAS